MTAPARSLPARSIETETLVPAAHVHDLMQENRELRRDLASLRSRIRQYRRAAAEAEAGRQLPAAPTIECGPRGDLFALITMARYGERMGRAPVLRFSRDVATDGIIGVELLFLRAEPGDEVTLATLPTGMACISGDESA